MGEKRMLSGFTSFPISSVGPAAIAGPSDFRPTPGTGTERGQQILAGIAETIPLSKQGSLLRAIAHNQAQTVVLGINQLTTGLFRAVERFAQKSFVEAERERMIMDRLYPICPFMKFSARCESIRTGKVNS